MVSRAPWRVGRIVGIELRIDASWFLIAVLVSYFFFLQFQRVFGGLPAGGAAALAISAALFFFGSVLVHELAHAVTARRRGIEVEGITLFLFGGATHARVESRGPGDELLVSAIGPLTSLGLAGVFLAARTLLRDILPLEVVLVIGFLAWLNLVLAVFNLLPGFPLDGGRILRALVWWATGSLSRATRIAGAGGQIVGYLMIAGGGLLALTGGLVSGIWLALIGWFLARSARAAYEDQRVRLLLERVEAADVMVPPLVRDLRGDPRTPRDGEPAVEPGTPVAEVIATLRHGDVSRVVVVHDRRVIGVITAARLGTWLAERGFPGF